MKMSEDKRGNRIRRNRLIMRPKWQQHLIVVWWVVLPWWLVGLSILISIKWG